MDGTGVAPPPMPAELPEADDEIDIEGDDDVPLLHHEVHAFLMSLSLRLKQPDLYPSTRVQCMSGHCSDAH